MQLQEQRSFTLTLSYKEAEELMDNIIEISETDRSEVMKNLWKLPFTLTLSYKEAEELMDNIIEISETVRSEVMKNLWKLLWNAID